MKTRPEKNVYLDNAATSFPKPGAVIDAMVRYMTENGSNVNRGGYASAYSAESAVFETRKKLCALFGGDDAKNVAFTSGVTASLNMLLKGLLKPGDHVIVSSLEHNSVMRPLRQLERAGVQLDRLPADDTGAPDMSALPRLLNSNTRALITLHASNVCGTLMPLEELGVFCRANGLVFIVDCAQTAGVFPIDMKKLHIDALAFTGHKGLLGPQGTGGFLIRDYMLSELTPLLSGGTGSVSHTEETPDFMPDRFEPGTPNVPGIYGLGAGLDYIAEQGVDGIRQRELALTGRLLDGLKCIKNVQIKGPAGVEGRAPVVSIQAPGVDSAEAAYLLDRNYGIQTRVGLHCAPAAHRTLRTYPEGTLRFSIGHANTEEDIDYCLEALERILGGELQEVD